MHRLGWIEDEGDDLSKRIVDEISRLPWMKENVTEDTVLALDWFERIDRSDEALVLSLLDMPFLESLESQDLLILEAVRRMARDEEKIVALTESPIFIEGIANADFPLVAAAGTLRDAGETGRMLTPGYGSVETWQGATGLTPNLTVSIVRTDGDPLPETMPEIVRILEMLEDFMGIPLPNPNPVFVFNDQSPRVAGSQGTRYGFAYGLRADREELKNYGGRELLPSVVIHEVAHDYFGSPLKSWYNHLPVIAFEYIYRIDGRDPGQVPVEILNVIERRLCEARNIKDHEEMEDRWAEREQYRCGHYLGFWLGRELLEAVGQEEFLARVRVMYANSHLELADGGNPGIEQIKELFPDQLEIVEKYWSGNVGTPESR